MLLNGVLPIAGSGNSTKSMYERLKKQGDPALCVSSYLQSFPNKIPACFQASNSIWEIDDPGIYLE
jgi:hypothetical protein